MKPLGPAVGAGGGMVSVLQGLIPWAWNAYMVPLGHPEMPDEVALQVAIGFAAVLGWLVYLATGKRRSGGMAP